MNLLLSGSACVFCAAVAIGQTGRVMVLRAPAIVGQTADFEMTYPPAAAGNPYFFQWSWPFANAVPVSVPGFVVHGLARVDPQNSSPLYSGVLSATGSVRHTFAVPNNTAYLGLSWDLQGLDLATASNSLHLADNELTPLVRLAQQWQQPILVDADVYDADLAVASSGVASTVWRDGTGNLQSSAYAPATGWGAAQALTIGPSNASDASVAADGNGNVLAVWTEGQSPTDVHASRYTVGVGWSTPVVIDNGIGNAYDAHVAIDGAGNGIAVWAQWSGPYNWGRSDLLACHWVAGVGWGTPVLIENDNLGDASAPNLAIDAAGNCTVVWDRTEAVPSGYTYGVCSNRFVVGSGWGAAVAVSASSPNNPNAQARVAVDGNGNAIAVWQELEAGYRKIWSSRRTGTWDTPIRLDPGSVNRSVEPQIVMDQVGNAIAVWIESDGVRDNLVGTSYAVGVGWGNRNLIENDNSGPVQEPRLAIDHNGYATAIWVHRNPGAYSANVWANQFVPGSGFGAPVQISGPPIVARSPRLGVDATGNLVATWVQQSVGSTYDLRSATFR